VILGCIYQFWLRGQSQSWPTVTGTIITSKLDSRSGRYARIEYEYVVDDDKYVSDNLAFGLGSKGGRDVALGMLAAHPVGKKVTVYYKPRSPKAACLYPGVVPSVRVEMNQTPKQ
jgi:hypothetical protein